MKLSLISLSNCMAFRERRDPIIGSAGDCDMSQALCFATQRKPAKSLEEIESGQYRFVPVTPKYSKPLHLVKRWPAVKYKGALFPPARVHRQECFKLGTV